MIKKVTKIFKILDNWCYNHVNIGPSFSGWCCHYLLLLQPVYFTNVVLLLLHCQLRLIVWNYELLNSLSATLLLSLPLLAIYTR